MNKKALVILSNGFEDIEAVSAIDVLTRVGVAVAVAALESGPVKGAYGIKLIPDTTISNVEDLYDAIVIPGGKENSKSLACHSRVIELIQHHFKNNKLVAAICAAPSHVLGEGAGILHGKRATGDPAFNEKLSKSGAQITGEDVTVDGDIITGMGPGSALAFALKVAEYLTGSEAVDGFRRKWRVS